jgi:hypothetical protein
MLMPTEPRRVPRRTADDLFDALQNRDLVAVTLFSAGGLLMTIALARALPLDKAVDLLMLFD